MNYMIDPKGHERKRKAKGGLSNSIVLGSVTVLAAVTVGTTSAAADSLDTVSTAPDTELVAKTQEEAPVVEAPATEAPATEAPAAEEPVVEAPATEAPAAEEPVVEAPAAEAPAAEEPVVEAPAAEAPVVEAPVAEDLPANTEVLTNPENGYTEDVDGNTVTVTSDELKDAIKDAKAEGVVVRQEPKIVSVGTASSQEEADALAREISTKQADDVEKIRQAQEQLAADRATAEAKTKQDGYLSTIEAQALSLRNSKSAKVDFENMNGIAFDKTKFEDHGSHVHYVFAHGELTENKDEAYSQYDPYTDIEGYKGGGYHLHAPSGKFSLTTTYTNVDGIEHNGRKVSRVEYDVEGTSSVPMNVVFYDDPVNFADWTVNANEFMSMAVKPRYYDEDGNRISLVGNSLLYIESLENNIHGNQAIEKVKGEGGEFLLINGSTIVKHGDYYYSDKDNWTEKPGGEFNWTRSIVFKPTSDDFTLYFDKEPGINGNYIWVGLQTSLDVNVVTSPNVSYSLYSYDTVGSVVLDNLIQGTTTKLTDTEIVKAAGTATGTDYTTSHAPTITTADGRTFTYVSSTNNTSGKVALGETKVVNYYVENKRGDVTVEYKDEDGNTLIPKVTDTPTTEVGKDYDTTDHRKTTISTDNKTYELVRTDGPEKGKVVEGNTNIVYIYQEVKGDVLVKYQDKDGNTLKGDVVDTSESSVGTSYDTKDNKPATITLTDGSIYRIVENLTKGAETGKVVKGTTVITYIYEPVLGNVTVEFKDDKGNTIKPKEVDTPDTNVGKDYDTVDRRTSTIVTPDGKTYDLIKTEGKETGKVVEGNTNVVYIYQEAKGTVVVRYQDTLGNTIKGQVIDTPETSTGVAYDTTDNKPQVITTDSGASYRINTGYTKGSETGKVVRGETVITYIYEQILGDVLVKYQDRKGGEVIPDVVDTPETSTGVSYDTTDNKPQIIERADGSTFRLVPTLTKGQEKGKVVEGTTTIIYIYDEIKGDVVVDYQNKANGETISPRVTDTPTTSTGTSYDTTDNKPVTIVTPDGRTFRIDPNVTKGLEVGKVIEGRTTVTYLYDELKGNVIVHYLNEEGKTIRKDIYDLKDSSTNRDYDTTDNKPVTIITDEGLTYDIVLEKTKGNETGKTVVGDTHVTYIYKEIFGDVIVHYEDEGGKVIHPEAFDTKQSSTGKAYDTTDLKHAAVFHDGSVYNIIVTKTKGVEKGLVARGTTHVTYVYKVEEPVSKKVVNNEAGRNIEGKTMLPGDLLVNRILIDNDQNKGLVGLTDADKEVGIFIVENYPEKFTEPVLEAVRIVYAGTDKVADIKTTTVLYNSITEAPQAIQERLKAQGYELKEGDKFSLTTSVDNKAYTENFALKGIQLELVFPTRVLKAAEASEFENVALVGDFNGVAITNVAINRVPKIDPKKDVFTTLADGMKNENSIDGKTAKLGDVVTFKFQGSFIPGDRGTELTSYGHNDTLSKLLRYDGNFKYFSDIETPLTNGTTLKAGEEITRYATQVIEHNEDGTTTVKFRLTDEFLKLLGDKAAFRFSKYVQATVIAEGLIENTQDEIINETVYSSNKVTVNVVPEPKPEPTPTPTPVPVTPAPVTPVPVTPAPVPVASVPATPAQPTLPETGEVESAMSTMGLVAFAAASVLGMSYKRKDN